MSAASGRISPPKTPLHSFSMPPPQEGGGVRPSVGHLKHAEYGALRQAEGTIEIQRCFSKWAGMNVETKDCGRSGWPPANLLYYGEATLWYEE